MAKKTDMSKGATIICWIAQVIAAVVLFQTLFFKFTGAEESIYIFNTLGMEPIGRYGSGVVELIAVILLLWPTYAWLGALLGAGSMAGAIFFHLTFLGIEVGGDGGLLFFLALLVLACCFVVLFIRRSQIPVVGARMMGKRRQA